MANRLADAVSPYLRSHAGNPVDWWQWGAAPFAEAARRDVPVLVSIGYSTCHWCHVMARESFSDPALAHYLNDNFVAIKVDREEHPDVDASYLAAAGAFTRELGWPLTVFVTPEGRAFHAGTYFAPLPVAGHPSFRQVLEAVADAWSERRTEVDQIAAAVARALAARATPPVTSPPADLAPVIAALGAQEDPLYGGFGTEPKFPVAPVLGFLLASGVQAGVDLAERTLRRMADSPLRDPVEGGFFRYSTRRDWSDPHYERMLYDNAQLLEAYVRVWQLDPGPDHWAAEVVRGVAFFLHDVLQLDSGGFASAQDSESIVDGERVEGGYYALSAAGRARQTSPGLDEKVLSGWNGLAIGALARAGVVFDRRAGIDSARRAADYLLDSHLLPDRLVRASVGGRTSEARATLEDYGMLAGGLLRLALATGEVRYADAARRLIDDTLAAGAAGDGQGGLPFAVPGGPDPVLAAQGLAIAVDPAEGAYPSGLSACAAAAGLLYALSAQARYRDAARTALALVAGEAQASPLGFGAVLELVATLGSAPEQLVVVTPDDGAADGSAAAPGQAGLVAAARVHRAAVTAIVTERQASALAAAGFALFEGRTAQGGRATAYLCRDFTCRLPVTDAAGLVAP